VQVLAQMQPKNTENHDLKRFDHFFFKFISIFYERLQFCSQPCSFFLFLNLTLLLRSLSSSEPTTRRSLIVGLHSSTLPGGLNRHLIPPATRPYCKAWLDDGFCRSCCCFADSILSRIDSMAQPLASLFWMELPTPPETEMANQ